MCMYICVYNFMYLLICVYIFKVFIIIVVFFFYFIKIFESHSLFFQIAYLSSRYILSPTSTGWLEEIS